MPKITTQRTKKAPKGWANIEPTLLELKQKLRDGQITRRSNNIDIVENEPIEGKRKPETVWPIFKLHH